MPYRIAADPWAPARRALPAGKGDTRRLLLDCLALIITGVGTVMLFTFVIDLALRPTLGPDEFPEREPFAFRLPRPFDFGQASHGCGASTPSYDVNRALRSGEAPWWESDPEGPEVDPESNPTRRRCVRPEPRVVRSRGVIEGRTTLVTDVGGDRVRSRRRHPAL